MILYDPADHYWIVGGDGTQVYSSARMAAVPVADETYAAWCVNGQATRIASMDDLAGVLRAANVAPHRTVTPRQARLALFSAGLLDQVEAAVTNVGGATKLSWDFATEIYEADPMIIALTATLSLTPEAVYQLFSQAAKF